MRDEKTTDDLRRLYDAHGGALYRFCHRLTFSADEAGDLVAEAFLDAARSKTPVGGMENPRAWLYRVAARRWIKRRRSLARLAPLLWAESLPAPPANDFTDLERALARLPDRLRVAFVVIRAEGHTYAEAALALGVPEGTLKSRVHEATALLRRDLGEALPEPTGKRPPMRTNMNPETLSTWRDDAPPADLRARVVESARPRRADLLPCLGLAGAMMGGVALAALLATAPMRAEAGINARLLVGKAQRALAAAPRVHLREFVDGGLVNETWFAGDRWRVTSPVGKGGDRIFRYGPLLGAVKDAKVEGEDRGPGTRTLTVPLSTLHNERKTEQTGPYEYRIGVDTKGRPVGLTYWSRRDGKVVSMLESAPQTRDFRMEALAPSYFPEGARLNYEDLGALRARVRVEEKQVATKLRALPGSAGTRATGSDSPIAREDARAKALLKAQGFAELGMSIPARRIQVTSAADAAARQTWTLRDADGLPIRLTRERRVEGGWHETGSVSFEYPTSIPAGTFDPQTLAEHGD